MLDIRVDKLTRPVRLLLPLPEVLVQLPLFEILDLLNGLVHEEHLALPRDRIHILEALRLPRDLLDLEPPRHPAELLLNLVHPECVEASLDRVFFPADSKLPRDQHLLRPHLLLGHDVHAQAPPRLAHERESLSLHVRCEVPPALEHRGDEGLQREAFEDGPRLNLILQLQHQRLPLEQPVAQDRRVPPHQHPPQPVYFVPLGVAQVYCVPPPHKKLLHRHLALVRLHSDQVLQPGQLKVNLLHLPVEGDSPRVKSLETLVPLHEHLVRLSALAIVSEGLQLFEIPVVEGTAKASPPVLLQQTPEPQEALDGRLFNL